jgi:radical SAM superfamily enzyme YgiQ (UPF0313 family)
MQIKGFRYKNLLMEIAILYPREKEVGMQAISVHWLQKMFPRARVFFLDSNLEDLNKADLILVSCHYENNYPYILQMLERAGIAIFRKQRNQKVYFGGVVAVNPYPLYDFIDAFFIGDFDSSVRQAILDEDLKKYEYVFIPEEKEFAKASRSKPEALFGIYDNTLYLEVQRGCRGRCRFCLIGWTKTMGFLEISEIKRIIKSHKIKSVFLVGSDIFSHPEIVELIYFLKDCGAKISFPSMRVEEVRKYEDIVKKLQPESFTIAPETCERLRKLLGKGFSDDEVVEVAEFLKSIGTKRLKLYFILGLPYESKQDLESCISLVERLRKTGLKLAVTFSIFVPKPHTPFQFAPFESVKSLSAKNKFVKKKLHFAKLHLTNPKKAFLQMLLSIGNREISKLLATVYSYGLNYSVWLKTAKALGIDLEKYSAEKTEEFHFDFETIDTGIRKKELFKIYEKYKEEASGK